MNFSSRFGVLAFAIVLCVLVIGTLVVLEEVYLIPHVEEEYAARLETVPIILAIANQEEIITSDLAALASNLSKSVASLQPTGVRYILIQDAEGEILSRSFAESWTQGERDDAIQNLKLLVPLGDTVGQALGGSVLDLSGLSESEREALRGKENQSAPEAALGRRLPVVEDRTVGRFTHAEGTMIDLAYPISTGRVNFGAVRVGVVDRVTGVISTVRTLTYTGAGIVAVFGIVAAWLLGGFLDDRHHSEADSVISAQRKEFTNKIRQLEQALEKKDESQPVTPTEFHALLDVARRATSTLDYNEVLDIGISSLLQILNVRDASIFVFDPATNELVGRVGHDENGYVTETEMSEIRVPVGKGDIGVAAEFGTTTIIDSPKPGTAVVSALVTRGRTIGVILVRNKLTGRPFIKKDQTILRTYSSILANAMENAAIVHHLS